MEIGMFGKVLDGTPRVSGNSFVSQLGQRPPSFFFFFNEIYFLYGFFVLFGFYFLLVVLVSDFLGFPWCFLFLPGVFQASSSAPDGLPQQPTHMSASDLRSIRCSCLTGYPGESSLKETHRQKQTNRKGTDN